MRRAILIAPIVGLALLGACDRRPVATSPPSTPGVAIAPAPVTGAATTAAIVRVADITGNWTNYQGKMVSVVADVEEVKGPRAFTLDEDAPFSGGVDNDLLVLSPKAAALSDIDDQWVNNTVRVSGVVHRFVTADIERAIGWDLDPKLEAEFDGKRPVLIATMIERVTR